MRPPPEKNRINLDFSNKIRYFLSKQASKQASPRCALRFGKALLLSSYAGRSP